MTGRGVDQVLPHPCAPHLYESFVRSAVEYVEMAERAKVGSNGPPIRHTWGDALALEWR